LLASKGVIVTSLVVNCLNALIHFKNLSLTLTSNSFVKSFCSGLDNLATANNSLLSLYKPTVVMYVLGSSINESNNTSPVEPEINAGFSE
jgi:hypothetical protein